jgi:hypothetical protein
LISGESDAASTRVIAGELDNDSNKEVIFMQRFRQFQCILAASFVGMPGIFLAGEAQASPAGNAVKLYGANATFQVKEVGGLSCVVNGHSYKNATLAVNINAKTLVEKPFRVQGKFWMNGSESVQPPTIPLNGVVLAASKPLTAYPNQVNIGSYMGEIWGVTGKTVVSKYTSGGATPGTAAEVYCPVIDENYDIDAEFADIPDWLINGAKFAAVKASRVSDPSGVGAFTFTLLVKAGQVILGGWSQQSN